MAEFAGLMLAWLLLWRPQMSVPVTCHGNGGCGTMGTHDMSDVFRCDRGCILPWVRHSDFTVAVKLIPKSARSQRYLSHRLPWGEARSDRHVAALQLPEFPLQRCLGFGAAAQLLGGRSSCLRPQGVDWKSGTPRKAGSVSLSGSWSKLFHHRSTRNPRGLMILMILTCMIKRCSWSWNSATQTPKEIRIGTMSFGRNSDSEMGPGCLAIKRKRFESRPWANAATAIYMIV